MAFVEFETAEEAQKAIRLTDGYALDKSHVFKVNSFEEAKRLGSLQEQYTPPSKPEFAPATQPSSWLGDPMHRDQFAIRYNNETEIKWCERSDPPTLEYGGEREKEGRPLRCGSMSSGRPKVDW